MQKHLHNLFRIVLPYLLLLLQTAQSEARRASGGGRRTGAASGRTQGAFALMTPETLVYQWLPTALLLGDEG